MRAFFFVVVFSLLVALSAQQEANEQGERGGLFISYDTGANNYNFYSTFTPGALTYSQLYIPPPVVYQHQPPYVPLQYQPYNKIPGLFNNPQIAANQVSAYAPFAVGDFRFTTWDGLFYEGFVFSSGNVLSYSLLTLLVIAVFTL